MCGVAGFCALNTNGSIIEHILLERMHNALRHRGPDGFGTWISQEYALGLTHRRLSIIDLSEKATQPMHDMHNRVVISYNGEIYNYQLLRTQLQEAGYHFFSRTDTEVLLYAYQHWGFQGMLDRLDGMFVIVLFDRVLNILFCVRDRIGIKPLYFSLQGGMFSFASEIKALWVLPWIQKKWQAHAVSHYLTYLSVPAPLTLYEGIYKLPAGHYIMFDAQRTMTVHRWFNLLDGVTNNGYHDETQIINSIDTLLCNAVHKRMLSDVPVGVFLSGGLDSSIITALMARHTQKVHSFTIAFGDGPEYDELMYARTVANYIGTQHHELTINEQDAFSSYQSMIHHQDEPLGDAVCVPLYHVSQLLKQSGVTVVQIGEGSDELFCGYDQYIKYLQMSRIWRVSQKMVPQFAKYSVYAHLSKRYAHSMNNLDIAHNWVHNRSLFYSGAIVFSELWKRDFCHVLTSSTEDPMVAAFFPRMHLNGCSYAMPNYYRQLLYHHMPHADQMQEMSYLELMHRLPELLLMRVDKMTMAHGVEARVPFLDYRLVQYALGMPMRYKYAHGHTKYILKKWSAGLLPDAIVYRKKMGFAAPTQRWYKQGLYFMPFLQELVAQKNRSWSDLLDKTYIDRMITQNKETTVDYSYQLWALQNLLACDV